MCPFVAVLQVEQIFDFIEDQEKEMGAAPEAFAVSDISLIDLPSFWHVSHEF